LELAAAGTAPLANKDVYRYATKPGGIMKYRDITNYWTKRWHYPVLGLMALLLSLTAFSQNAERTSEDLLVRFSDATSIRSVDGGQSWLLAEGTLKDIPYWAQNWLKNDEKAAPEAWKPRSVAVKLESGGTLRRSAGSNNWKSESAERAKLPSWARLWLEDAPIRLPSDLLNVPVQSLCQGEKPMQRTQTYQVGPDLAVRSFDGGQTWVMAQGNREDLPDWVAAWLEKPAVEVQAAKELAYGDALIRSVDGGLNWTLVQGKMEDLPDWVRPWLGDSYPTVNQASTAKSAENALPEGFELFPNPSQNHVTLRFDLKRKQEVRILLYDLQGKLLQEVYTGNMPAGSRELDFSVSDLATGAYFLQFIAEDRQERIRLMRSR
jgi:hypothetical protein